ncbi:hypothetical protein K504DRAFT_410084 [Pleomassaria siparia CBS 279.74]|uniref:NTF2-like protein n=1 Tax=Pleomassaria siparia CBS 279.74 TaxID=1314801 RepID=A0A6G1K420_9PLEO|nr:hypothetical protein K504DRAFT_410084 [Pleomassaria siparia CBS 279.74]
MTKHPTITTTRPPIILTTDITLQSPLSRRGHGPGLILVVNHYAATQNSETCVDPAPLQKWAEEGFAVAQVKVPGRVGEGGEFPLQRALEGLRGLEGFDGGNVALISYLSRIPFYVEEAACLTPSIKALISYGGKKFTSISPTSDTTPSTPPQLLHIPGPEVARRESLSVVPSSPSSLPTPSSSITASEASTSVKIFRYESAKRDSGWALPADEDYDGKSAQLAHTRSLSFLKPLLEGPYFDLEAVWDEHCKFEFVERDVASTMATMVDRPYVNHIPTMTGGIGKERLTAFYTSHFIFSNPENTTLDLVSRTIGIDRVVDEFVFKLTHDRVVEWLLPSVPPTNKPLSIPFVSIVTLRGDRLAHEHIHWDQGTALQQLGLLPKYVDFPYPVEGREGGGPYEIMLPVAGEETARKLVDENCEESNLLMGREGRAA